MRPPQRFLHGNLVFGPRASDVWAAYRLHGESYTGLSLARKRELKDRLEGFAYAVDADFTLIRSAGVLSPEDFRERALATLDPRHGDRERFEGYVEEQCRRLAEREVVRPEVYLVVSLAPPSGARGPLAGLAELWAALESALGLGDPRGLGRRELGELRRLEARLFERVLAYLPGERARSGECAQLIRRSYARGLGEPRADANWRPQALWLDCEDAEGRFEPYEWDLLRLHESRVGIEGRHLRIETELGTAYQALLVVGALPEEALFPGQEAELLFAPLELGFPIDAAFTAEYIPNREARRLARKRKVDADQQAAEESYSEHGPSVRTAERPHQARELEARLTASDRAPLLRAAITLAVGAPSAEELERRVERLRSEFGRVELHRPLGEQHRLFLATMPAARFPVPDYKQHLLPEQFGAMVPTAISHAGSEIGPLIGHTLDGSRQPVQFDLAEAAKQNRPPTVLLTGSLGSGKTLALQLFLYQAFLQGSWPIVDVDPKGDHRLERLPGVAERIEVIELGPEERYRGLLDPMRIAAADAREDLAYGFLTSILPAPVEAEWQTEIRAAVARAGAREAGCTAEVLAELAAAGTAAAEQARRALEVHLASGLARLALGEPGRELPGAGEAQVVSLRIRNLTLPAPGTPRFEFQEEERVSQAVLRLLAAYALRLCASDPGRHSVLALDEAWGLLGDSQGHALIARLSRMGRSMNITVILASQMLGDAEQLEPLVGTFLSFGVEVVEEAEGALELLRLDADDRGLSERLMGFRRGRCYLRDFEGRCAPVQVELSEPELSALDNTPARATGALPRGEEAEAKEGRRELAAL